MSMSGGLSFFEPNAAQFRYGTLVAASSNQNDARYILHTNKLYRWQSLGSNDATLEELTITLPALVSLSRLFLMGHNLKEFSVRYGGWLDFADVKSLDGPRAGIAETENPRSVNYYEFTPVVTDTIRIRMKKTHIANAQKFLSSVILTNEIGTFEGYPDTKELELDRNETEQPHAAAGLRIIKAAETAKLRLRLAHYPVQADLDIISTLQEREEPFYVWPCGGRDQGFRFKLRGWRLEDLFLMQVSGPLKMGYADNIYTLGADGSLVLKEVSR